MSTYPNKSFSQLPLWDWQYQFFTEAGPDAWRKSIVPHYITSNTFIAHSYAKVAISYLRDCWTQQLIADPQKPIYVIDIGAGCGRFAYHFILQFFKLVESLQFSCKIVYVLADIAEANLKFWQTHPSFKPYLAKGLVDFARFNAETDQTLHLEYSKTLLQPQEMVNPSIIIANYLFDGIRNDLLYCNNQQLFQLSVKTYTNLPSDRHDPATLLAHATLGNYRKRRIQADYYQKPSWTRLLLNYQNTLNDTTLLFPTAGLSFLENIQQLTNRQCLVLTADQGSSALAPDLEVYKHGSFSLPVNYHALGAWVEQQGGVAWQTKHPYDSLNIAAYLLAPQSQQFCETRQAYQEAILDLGPNALYRIKQLLEVDTNNLSLAECSVYLHLTHFDYKVFLLLAPRLNLTACRDTEREYWFNLLQQVWQHYYPIGEDYRFGYYIGYFLMQLQYWDEALTYFKWDHEFEGEDAHNFYNQALCYWQLKNAQETTAQLDKALAINPDLTAAINFRQEISQHLAPPMSVSHCQSL
jgi:tetratricopeptide (TPR) repeat protein